MISIFGIIGNELPTKEKYRLIKKAGFDGVFMHWDDKFGDYDFRSNPGYARNEGLCVENMHTPFERINSLWDDNLEGQSIVDNLQQCVMDCATYDIPTMIVHISGGNNPPAINNLGLNRIKTIVEKAERNGINIALENLRRPDYLDAVFDQIKSDRLGFCYDSGHHHCRTPNLDLLGKFGSKLMALHLHDNDGYITGAGSEDQHRLPFDGTIDWPTVMKKIAGTGYTGATALEVVNMGYEYLADKPEEFLHIAYERAKKLEGLRNREV